MRDIEREFDAAPELAALVADMLEEMDELRARHPWLVVENCWNAVALGDQVSDREHFVCARLASEGCAVHHGNPG